MSIEKRVKQYVVDEGWPTASVTLGPDTCGGKCRKLHAHAQAVASTVGSEVFYSFIYRRPCNAHERVRKDKRWSTT